mmetsp:Transcript_29650/g.94898  ORF Transcript_29650/g.94898 Transcript_29650/m.94898 type:complete len:201 (+) Transcript_29650:556-1158(+)
MNVCHRGVGDEEGIGLQLQYDSGRGLRGDQVVGKGQVRHELHSGVVVEDVNDRHLLAVQYEEREARVVDYEPRLLHVGNSLGRHVLHGEQAAVPLIPPQRHVQERLEVLERPLALGLHASLHPDVYLRQRLLQRLLLLRREHVKAISLGARLEVSRRFQQSVVDVCLGDVPGELVPSGSAGQVLAEVLVPFLEPRTVSER